MSNFGVTRWNVAVAGIVTAFIGTFGATSAQALPEVRTETVQTKPAVGEITAPVAADSKVQLSFERPAVKSSPAPPPPVDPLIAVASADPEAQISKNFDVLGTIKAARSELGKSFPTGWNQPGECLVAAKRWITSGGGNWFGAGTPIANYVGAKEVDYKNAAPGDVIQYLAPENPNAWVSGVHTILVTKNNMDGTLEIIEANNPGGSGFVSENKHWTPAPPAGLVFKVFRF